ncbi:MAG: leucine-rich repeat domain-containing protein [Lachnospiraceae bacterium]|jgi:hypothetical protein|nr:leucine-rich repeat domain-containing protein [Lachnospiraceae bacterium]
MERDGSGRILEYRGNVFMLEDRSCGSPRRRFAVTGIVVRSPEVFLPDRCGDDPVIEWVQTEENLRGGPCVRLLGIPAGILIIRTENRFFPALERVEVAAGHTMFSTDGRMLLSRDGRRLLYALAAGNGERAEIPARVRRVEDGAFAGTRCREIVAHNPEITAGREAFLKSAWLEAQGDFALLGNMFYRLNRPVDELRVPDTVRRFHGEAFAVSVPRHLITPVLPGAGCLYDLGGGRGDRCQKDGGGVDIAKDHGGEDDIRGCMGGQACREITFISGKADSGLDPMLLRRVGSLRAVHMEGSHRRYRCADGVVFSGDGRVLEYYPPQREEESYTVPDGVVKIACGAFAGSRYLRSLTMPDSVKTVGVAAFYGCGQLSAVRLSDSIGELPDGIYGLGGVFENCRALVEVRLPRGLSYLGSFAFYGSGLRKVRLPQGIRGLGEYSLGAEGLRRICLPSSVERLGKGSLLFVGEIHACAGTARGLLEAVNAPAPESGGRGADLAWRPCRVFVHHRGGRTEKFRIPGSLRHGMAGHLEMAWDGKEPGERAGGEIDYEEYDACFEAVEDSGEKLEMAGLACLRYRDDENWPCKRYIGKMTWRIADRLVQEGMEEELLALMGLGLLSAQAMHRLSERTRECGLTEASEEIEKYLGSQRRAERQRHGGLQGGGA